MGLKICITIILVGGACGQWRNKLLRGNWGSAPSPSPGKFVKTWTPFHALSWLRKRKSRVVKRTSKSPLLDFKTQIRRKAVTCNLMAYIVSWVSSFHVDLFGQWGGGGEGEMHTLPLAYVPGHLVWDTIAICQPLCTQSTCDWLWCHPLYRLSISCSTKVTASCAQKMWLAHLMLP